MEQKWPNVKSPTTASSYQSWSTTDTSFWDHEWNKHGTCSNMDQYTYFYTALQLLLPTPSIIKERYDSSSSSSSSSSRGDDDDYGGGTVTRSELITGYATSTTTSNDFHRDIPPPPLSPSLSSYLKGQKETVLVCSKNGYLSEVRVCYEKTNSNNNTNNNTDKNDDNNGKGGGGGNVGKRIPCPELILREDNCGETIKIASFNERPNSAISM